MQCLGFNHIKQCLYRLQPKKYPLSHPPSLEPVFVCPFWATVETYFVTRSLNRHKKAHSSQAQTKLLFSGDHTLMKTSL